MAYIDKFALFPPMLRKAARWADVVHICDHSNAMYSGHLSGKPCVVTCHDMLAVRGAFGEDTDCPASRTGVYLQKWVVRGLERAQIVACVSSATESDVLRIVHGRSQRVTTVLNGLNYRYMPSNGTARSLLGSVPGLDASKPFVLHVGHNHPRKNKRGAIRAFAIAAREMPDLQLVLAGPPLTPELQQLVQDSGISDRVFVVVKPPNEVLQALYSTALCLLFPSRFEGFGWPLIEAQACGCPVVCSQCSPFNEVLQGTGITRNAEDEGGFAGDLLRLARNPEERAFHSAQGLANARRFAPERMVNDYIDLYRSLLQ